MAREWQWNPLGHMQVSTSLQTDLQLYCKQWPVFDYLFYKLFISRHMLTVISARPTGGSTGGLFDTGPAPYQRGPPQEYLEAVTNKRLTEEVR